MALWKVSACQPPSHPVLCWAEGPCLNPPAVTHREQLLIWVLRGAFTKLLPYSRLSCPAPQCTRVLLCCTQALSENTLIKSEVAVLGE